MASTSSRRRTARASRPLPQPAYRSMASTSAPRQSARARRLLPQPEPADRAMPSKSARRRSARARRRPLPHPADRATPSTSVRRRSARGPASDTFLPDVIWEEVFLRLDAEADLARAYAVCFSFRCIVSNPRFLRRLRSLRPPAVLGFISSDSSHRFLPVGPPHSSAPEARVLELAADFTFSFLPKPSTWHSRHAHDGRVLLSRRISTKVQLDDFIVCDPLHRRYVKIPRIPAELMASAADNGIARLPVLVPAGEDEEEKSFRVICTLQHKRKGKVMVLVFSSCDQTWRGIISTICLPNGFIVWKPYYAHGCLYWMFYRMGYALSLDTSEMKFSVIDLPSHNFDSLRAIVGAEEGRLGLLTLGDDTIDLYWKNGQSNGVGVQEWQHDRLIQLPKDNRINYNWAIVGTVGRYLALRGCRHIFLESLKLKSEYFVLDTKTLLLEKVCTWSDEVFLGIPYVRFPFAVPSI